MKSIPLHKFSPNSSIPGFEIITWSEKVNPYDSNKPHRHQYHEMLFFLQGKGIHEIEFEKHIFKTSSVHFVSASTVHAVLREPGSKGFSILYATDFLPSGTTTNEFHLIESGQAPILNLGKSGMELINPTLLQLQLEYNQNQPRKREALQSLFQLLFIQLYRIQTSLGKVSEKQKPKAAIAIEIEALIESHFLSHWRAKDYAQALNTSVANLTLICKKNFSLTVEQLAHQRIILETKRQLAYSTKPIKEICFDLAFEDPAYFNRFFKKHTGLTPVQYREALSH